MSQITKRETTQGRKIHRDDYPKIGEWYWVRNDDDKGDTLMCVTAVGSNYVEFHVHNDDDGGSTATRVHNREIFSHLRPEPQWKEIWQGMLEKKQLELKQAVALLADACQSVDLGGTATGPDSGATMLPALRGKTPDMQKLELEKLKEETLPQAKKNIDAITGAIAGISKNLFLNHRAKADQLSGACKEIDDRLFALELYAGLADEIYTLRKGEPAPPETPVAVRQMLRYMDEETLIDFDKGGIDFSQIDQFDEWVAKPENFKRLLPEPRCVVAVQVRRHMKDYGTIRSLWDAWQQCEWHQQNKKTYLLMRNGENLFRLWCEIEFAPRLLPLREEFMKPLVRTQHEWFTRGKKSGAVVTPDDLDYDTYAGERKNAIKHYNRTVFLLQGLLDRTKVFAPHPPINLGDTEQAQKYFKGVYDEEDGLPSSNPPNWETYRNELNSKLRKGKFAWCATSDDIESEDHRGHARRQKRRGYYVNCRPTICEVSSISKDGKTVEFSWPWGTRWGYEHGDWGKYGEWPVNRMCHQKVPVEEVFNVTDYTPGDYKRFLCDAYHKGAYLKWAPQMLGAEKWHMERAAAAKNAAKENVKKRLTFCLHRLPG